MIESVRICGDFSVTVNHPPRSVPFALHDKVEQELERLQKQGTLEPVDIAEWAAPIYHDEHTLYMPKGVLFREVSGGVHWCWGVCRSVFVCVAINSDWKKFGDWWYDNPKGPDLSHHFHC